MESELTKLKDMKKVMFIESISKLQDMKKRELIAIAKDMGFKGYSHLKKAELIELINNPPSPPSDDELKEMKLMTKSQLRNKVKEMGLQRYSRLNKDELLELINNPVQFLELTLKSQTHLKSMERHTKFRPYVKPQKIKPLLRI